MQTIHHHNVEVPVRGENLDAVINSTIFTPWINSIDPSFIIHCITIESFDTLKHNGNVFLIKLKADITLPHGAAFKPTIILRHRAVAALCVLICDDKKYVVLVNQPRFAVGKNVYELPAGMVDDDTHPEHVILRELEEEVRLASITGINASDVKNLGTHSLDSSPGFTNETLDLFYVERIITKEQFKKLQGLHAGLIDEGESIIVSMVPYEDVALKCHDSKTLAALYLYEHLK